MKRANYFLIVLAANCMTATGQAHLPPNFFTKKLPNGLEILVIEDSTVPLATLEITVKNGAFTEPPEYDGLSHLYEHMFFKANRDYPSQEAFLGRIHELGIVFNGTTSEERVNYFVTLQKQNLEPGLRFLNSALRYPLFLEEEMKKENPVVDGEFQRNESNPRFFLHDQLSRHLWGDQYSRKNTIGDHNIINSATPEKMRIIKDKYYYPNNSLVSVAGDVQHEEVFRLVEQICGDWQPSEFDPFQKWPVPDFKPLDYSGQFVVESPNARIPVFMFGWHGPDTRTDMRATYAADVFSFILSQRNSKLNQELVDSGLAYDVSLNYQTLSHVGPVVAMLIPDPQHIPEALSRLREHVERWDSDDYFTDEQLQTAKEMLAIQDAYAKEQVSQYLHSITYWWAVSSIDYYTTYVENVRKVTREDIKAYVRKYVKGRPYMAGLLIHPSHRQMLGADQYFTSTALPAQVALSFGHKVTAVDSSGKAALEPLVQWLQINPSVKVRIDCYADKSEKKKVPDARKNAVFRSLTESGISPERLTVNVTVLKGGTGQEMSANRKAVFSILPNP